MNRISLSRTEVHEIVNLAWDWRLRPWQLEDLHKFVVGGVFAYSIPTYCGKSSMCEQLHVLRLIGNGNRRQVAVKSNDTTANEMTVEVCRRLQFIATDPVFHKGGAPAFPHVEPTIRWQGRSGGERVDPWRHSPYGVKDGFDVVGIDHRHRHRSAFSFRAYGIGDRDLQGKGGDTTVDDVETLAHADSEAERRLLAQRLDGVLRTIEADAAEILWLLVGTPMYAESVYNSIVERMEGLPIPWERILRPFRNQDGSLLMPEMQTKVEVQRATMSKRAFNAAFELTPPKTRSLDANEIQEAIRDYSMPWIDNERQFGQWILDWAYSNTPPYMAPTTWRLHVEERLSEELKLYIGWDPATENDWAIVLLAMWGDYGWILRCKVDDTDTWDQMMCVRDLYLSFPSSRFILETNGQQKVFLDVAREDEVLAQVPYARHTSQGKKHGQVGMPVMMEHLRQGVIRTPWGDAGLAEAEFAPLEREIQRYSSTGHFDVLMATWFGWRFHRRSRGGNSVRHRVAQEELKRQTRPVQIETPRTNLLLPNPATGDRRSAAMRERSARAWRRRH